MSVPLLAGLRGCARLQGPLSACLGGEAGLMRARSVGISVTGAASGLWLGASAGALLEHRVASGWSLRLLGEAVYAPLRPRFRIEIVDNGVTRSATAHAPSAFTGRLLAGVELSFWP